MGTTRIARPAALALGLVLVIAGAVAAPAALAYTRPDDDVPDLTISQTTSVTWGGCSVQEPGGPVTYTLTVKNPSFQVWDAELHRYYPGGAAAHGVVVNDYLPDGSQFLSMSADSGFTCSRANLLVVCSGGTLPKGGTAHITINTKAPPLMATYYNGVTVDPYNTVAERNEGNNTSTLSLGVVYLN